MTFRNLDFNDNDQSAFIGCRQYDRVQRRDFAIQDYAAWVIRFFVVSRFGWSLSGLCFSGSVPGRELELTGLTSGSTDSFFPGLQGLEESTQLVLRESTEISVSTTFGRLDTQARESVSIDLFLDG